MLTIRLARVGKKNKAQFKIMLQEHTAAPGGKHVEVLGSHDPHLKQTVLKEERIRYWLEKGAQSSDTVYNLLVSKGLIVDKKRPVKIPARSASDSEASEPAKKAEEAQNNTETKQNDAEGKKTEETKVEEKPVVEKAIEEKQEEPKKEEAKTEEAPKEEAK